MLTVRHAQPRDFEALRQLHAQQGLSYELPDLNREDWAIQAVLETHARRPEMAVLLRSTAETYFLVGSDAGSKKERIGKILALQQAVGEHAKSKGLRDVCCWLPPQMNETFGKLLMHIGWKKPEWISYFKEL
jgi:hypothetical protein